MLEEPQFQLLRTIATPFAICDACGWTAST